MATDYRHRSRAKKKRKPVPGWVWLVTGLLLGLFIAFLGYLQSKKIGVASVPAQVHSKKNPVTIPEPKRPRFDFYTILPEMEVIVPDEEIETQVRKATSPKTTAGKDTYFLQVGSFKSSQDADALRATLSLSGHATLIQTVKINQDTWHRVRVGPFHSFDRVKESRRALETAGMKAIPLKVK